MTGSAISSSLIRELLVSGGLDTANRYLGYDYFLRGEVVDGNKIGRTIGFPTANVRLHDSHKLVPADGVYAVEVDYRKERYRGMLSIGVRPTIKQASGRTIEVNLFDVDADLYGEDITVIFRKRMRDEKKFDTIEQLRVQLVKDRETALEILGKDSWL